MREAYRTWTRFGTPALRPRTPRTSALRHFSTSARRHSGTPALSALQFLSAHCFSASALPAVAFRWRMGGLHTGHGQSLRPASSSVRVDRVGPSFAQVRRWYLLSRGCVSDFHDVGVGRRPSRGVWTAVVRRETASSGFSSLGDGDVGSRLGHQRAPGLVKCRIALDDHDQRGGLLGDARGRGQQARQQYRHTPVAHVSPRIASGLLLGDRSECIVYGNGLVASASRRAGELAGTAAPPDGPAIAGLRCDLGRAEPPGVRRKSVAVLYEGRVPPDSFRTDPTGAHLYSAFFDLTAVALEKVIPLDRYVVRHALNAVFGWLGSLDVTRWPHDSAAPLRACSPWYCSR